MKLVTRGLWMRAALAATLLVPLGYAAEDVVQLRSDERVGVPTRMLPFTTFSQERAAVLKDLPCKWLSVDGRLGPSYGRGRYDFLCKAGNWGTVTLFLDRASGSADGLGRVRLMYRVWPETVHPNAAEAYIAQKFVQHVLNRLIPAKDGQAVQDALWSMRAGSWQSQGVQVAYAYVDRGEFGEHRLEIVGDARDFDRALVQQLSEHERVTPTDAGLLLPLPQVQAETVPLPLAPLPDLAPGQVVSATQPTVRLPQPETVPVSRLVSGLVVPDDVPQAPTVLPKATPAELRTAPAPESLTKPTPPPPVAESLQPATQTPAVRPMAPSNFDVYNKAEQLTRDVEQKAFGKTAPKVQPVAPTPAAPSAPTVPQDAGLTKPVAPTVAPQLNPQRALPQLEFVPKEEPLPVAPDEVIRFEDEQSGL